MASATQLEVGWPLPIVPINPSPSFGNFTLDGTTDTIEVTFQAREAATITHLGFRYGTRVGTPPTFKIDLQSVSATTGLPAGTVGGGTPASATFTPPADATWDGTWQWIALDNAYTCARGEILAIVIAYSSGTIDGSNKSSFTTQLNSWNCRKRWPTMVENSAGSRATANNIPIWGYKSSTTTYGCPIKTTTVTGYSSGSTPDEKGMLFTLPSGWAATCTIVGVYVGINVAAAGGTFDITLYDTDGTTALQTLSVDIDQLNRAQNLNGEVFIFYFDEVTLSTLTVGSTYRVALAATSAGVALGLAILQVDASNDWTAFPGSTNFQLTTRTDAGAWTEDATQRPMMGLILDDLTEPSGGSGGLLRHPGMVGGLAA